MNRKAMKVISTLRTIREIIGEFNLCVDAIVRMLWKISKLILIISILIIQIGYVWQF